MNKSYDVIDKPFITEYSVLQNNKAVHQLSTNDKGVYNFKIRIGIGQLMYSEAFQKLHIDFTLANLSSNSTESPHPLSEGREANIPPEEKTSFIFEADYSIPRQKVLDNLAGYLRITVFILTESLKDGLYRPASLLDTALFFKDSEEDNGTGR